ncbi:hypothetical protein ACHAWU_003637 [Discostella pseudostelligera]|uniref:UDP-galactopyranose mutase C-terminal domain-containing protein n=1 Tax=Discostella pseudostelligera TaxID=259834 RepID=A0ABD3M9N0_9STRA
MSSANSAAASRRRLINTSVNNPPGSDIDDGSDISNYDDDEFDSGNRQWSSRTYGTAAAIALILAFMYMLMSPSSESPSISTTALRQPKNIVVANNNLIATTDDTSKFDLNDQQHQMKTSESWGVKADDAAASLKPSSTTAQDDKRDTKDTAAATASDNDDGSDDEDENHDTEDNTDDAATASDNDDNSDDEDDNHDTEDEDNTNAAAAATYASNTDDDSDNGGTSTTTTNPIFDKEYDNCIVGAGLSGSVIAENYANLFHKTSLIIERRDHIGGNCFDYIDKDTGIRVSLFGAHLFHTKHQRVWDYVRRFGDWVPYEHRVLGLVNGKHVPIPVTIDTVNILFDLNITNSDEMDEWLKDEQVKLTDKKGKPREALNSEEMLDSPYITVVKNTDYFDVKDQLKCKRLYYTGPIDTYFADLKWPKLEYRSLSFERVVQKNTPGYFQPAPVVNHPQATDVDGNPVDFTRIVEYKHLLNQTSKHTIYFIERSTDDGEPYYPIPNDENKNLYLKYQKMAEKEEGVTFVGRLANYKYFNMDDAILNALELFDRDTVGMDMEKSISKK